MTKKELFLSIVIGTFLGLAVSQGFMRSIDRGMDARDAAQGIDRNAIIEEVLK